MMPLIYAEKEAPQIIRKIGGSPEVKKHLEKGVKCSGCWKAYTNSSQAEKTFRQFKKCTEVYCRKAKGGRPLENMIVAE